MRLETLGPILMMAAAAPGAGPPGSLTAAERADLVAYLESTRDEIAAVSGGLSPAQARHQTAPDRWAVVHVLEHLALIEDAVRDGLPALLATPPLASPLPGREETRERIRRVARDRETRFQAPVPVRPQGRWDSLEEALAAFSSRREATLRYVRSTNDPLDAHALPHPVLGFEADGFLHLWTLAAHSERHLAQIREILADPSFPAE